MRDRPRDEYCGAGPAAASAKAPRESSRALREIDRGIHTELLALNALAWSIAAPRGYALLDAWPIFADAFGRESLGYDGYHYTYSLKNFREKGGGGKASSRERDGAPPRCTVVGVLDFIRASRLLDEHVCPAACAPP